MEIITSIDNPKIKRIIKLKEKKYRDIERLFIIETPNIIREALKNNALESVYVTDTNNMDIPNNIKKYVVSKSVMKSISSLSTPSNILGISPFLEEKEITDRILILDNIQDPGNMGTIIRSAAAFNIKTIIIGNDCCDIYNIKAIRSTEGNLYKVNILRKDLDTYIPFLKENNYYIYGTDCINGIPLKKIKFKDKMAIIIGSEGHGIKSILKEYIDSNIYVPMSKDIESLNAGVAAAIIMYEVGNYE